MESIKSRVFKSLEKELDEKEQLIKQSTKLMPKEAADRDTKMKELNENIVKK